MKGGKEKLTIRGKLGDVESFGPVMSRNFGSGREEGRGKSSNYQKDKGRESTDMKISG